MKIFLIILLLVDVAAVYFFIDSCTGKKKLASFAAACGEHALTLEVYEQRQYAYSYHFLLIRYPGIRPIRIDQRDITSQRMPYRRGMYDRVPHVSLDTVIRPVAAGTGTGLDTASRYPFILYVDPGRYSEAEFAALGDCLRAKWRALEDKLYAGFITPQRHLNYPQLMAAVYGRQSDFIALYEAADRLIRILPDGRVELVRKAELADGNVALAGNVLPDSDSIVFSRYGSETVPADFSAFRHTGTGRAINEDFRITVQEFKW